MFNTPSLLPAQDQIETEGDQPKNSRATSLKQKHIHVRALSKPVRGRGTTRSTCFECERVQDEKLP